MGKKETKSNSNRARFLLVIILLSLFMLSILAIASKNLLWDENVYLSNARSHIAKSNYTEDFRFPLLEYILALAWTFGESLFTAKLIVILFSAFTVGFFYQALKEYARQNQLFDSLAKIRLFALSFALSPLILFWGFRIYADVPMLFFISLAFLLFMISERLNAKKSNILMLIAGISSALAFLSRFPAALFVICLVFCLIYKRAYKNLAYFSLGFAVAIAPWLIHNYTAYHDVIWDLKQQYNVIAAWTYPEPITKQVLNLFVYTGMTALFMIFGILQIILLAIQNRKVNLTPSRLLILTYTIISFVYYFFFVNLKDARYYLAFLPFIYLLAFEGYYLAEKLIKKYKKILMFIIILNIIVLFVGTLIYMFSYSCLNNCAVTQTINYIKPVSADIIEKNQVVLSNFWPYIGYSLNVKTASLWTNNLNELFSVYNIRYIAYSPQAGEFNKTLLDSEKRLKLEKVFNDNHGTVYLYDRV